MASKRIQKVRHGAAQHPGCSSQPSLSVGRSQTPAAVQELKDLQKDPPTSCSAGTT